jgi:hypothetical protein
MDDIGKELMLKSNIKDLLPLMDIQSSVEEVNHAFQKLTRDLGQKVNVSEFK